MPRASNVSISTGRSKVAARERRIGCPRVRFGSMGNAHNVCRVESYVRVNRCTRTQMTRVLVHWFDPRCMRFVVVAGRMH
jgi:hypothetical protein